MSAILVDAREARATAEKALDSSERILAICAIAINGAAAKGECSTFVALLEYYPEEYESPDDDSKLLGSDGEFVLNKLGAYGYQVNCVKRDTPGYCHLHPGNILFGLLITW